MKKILLPLTIWIGAVLLMSCTSPAPKHSETSWAEPAPSAPDMASFNRGEAGLRPTIHSIAITHYDSKNGWLVAPSKRFDVVAEVEGAEKVTAHVWGVLEGDRLNPDPNGRLPGSPVRTEGNPSRWRFASGLTAGRNAGIYVVAENANGRSVSPVMLVAWCWECAYPVDQLWEP